MAADFGLIVYAAERDAHEVAARGVRDRLAERGLADARRTDQAQDRPGYFPFPTIFPTEGAARRMLFSIQRLILGLYGGWS